jgi:hypothetical protein
VIRVGNVKFDPVSTTLLPVAAQPPKTASTALCTLVLISGSKAPLGHVTVSAVKSAPSSLSGRTKISVSDIGTIVLDEYWGEKKIQDTL